jgi:hypothetical protein
MKRAVMGMLSLAFVLAHALPAMADGDVRATMLRNGNLKIIGDHQNNQILVTYNGTDNIRVEGMLGTTVNGGVGGTDFPSTGNKIIDGKLDINLKGGDNYVEIKDITVTRSLLLRLTHGDNTIGIFNTTVLDDASLKMGNGDNFIAISGDTWIDDKLTINTGNGNDRIEIAECVNIDGKTMIKTQSGDDVINLKGAYLGPLTLDTGRGIDQLYISQYSNDKRVNILLGNDDDMILFASTASLTGTIRINGGRGDNDTLIQDNDQPTDFPATARFIENVSVDAADDVPVAITAQMVLEYIVRGGDGADISCP